MKRLVISLIALLSLNACHFDFRIVRGNGNVVVKELDLDDFTDVNIGGNFKVELYHSDNPGIIIETDENLIEHIEIEVSNNLLTINAHENLKPTDELLIEVYYNDLRSIKSSGASSIEHHEPLVTDRFKVDLSGAGAVNLNVEVKELDLNLSGAGMMELSGYADSQVVNLSGAGSLEAKNMECKYCEIHISGIGNAKVNVSQELNANISGLGNIEYVGNPAEIVKNVSGLGKVKRSDDNSDREDSNRDDGESI